MKTYETIFDAVDRTGRTHLELMTPLILDPETTPHGYRADGSGCPVTIDPELWARATTGNMEALRKANQIQAGCIYDHPKTRAWLKQMTWEAIYGSLPRQRRQARERLASVVVGVKDANRDAGRVNTREAWKMFGVMLQHISMIRAVRETLGEVGTSKLFPAVTKLKGCTDVGRDREVWTKLIMTEKPFETALYIMEDIVGLRLSKLRHEVVCRGYDARSRKKWIAFGKGNANDILFENRASLAINSPLKKPSFALALRMHNEVINKERLKK
jgi:hypothetical protein